MVADYSELGKECKTSDGTFIELFYFLEEHQKLMDYMKVNKLKIKPGLYVIKKFASFEQIITILKFEQIE